MNVFWKSWFWVSWRTPTVQLNSGLLRTTSPLSSRLLIFSCMLSFVSFLNQFIFFFLCLLLEEKNDKTPNMVGFSNNFSEMQDVIPHMAQEYGFEYELVTYKWPTWLHKQKEKQRIIWAYKILFLDVIFPLSLEKVFYLFCLFVSFCFFYFEIPQMWIWHLPLSIGHFCWRWSGCQGRHGRTLWHGYKRKASSIYSFLWQQQGYGWISILETSNHR